MALDNDNTFAQATDLGAFPGSNSLNVKGNVSFIDDRLDFYRINVAAPTRFVAALTPKTSDADLTLFDSNGKGIESASNLGTSLDVVSSDNLSPGVYFLEIRKNGSGSTDYDLGVNGSRITSAELGVTIKRITALERFDLKIPFSSSFKADFLTRIRIDGQERNSGVFDKDSDDVRPNFTFKQAVPLNKRVIDVSIRGQDEDPTLNDIADFGNTQFLRFDTAEGTFSISSFQVKEGAPVTLEGTRSNFGIKRARVEFQMDYNTFTTSSTALQTAPMIVGSGTDITGRDIGGILVGNDRHNTLSAKGGNDAVYGGKGNDLLDAGTGNDITYGGDGKDIHVGGAGRDVFVVDLDSKSVDLFKDFQINRDRIGLPFALQPDMIDVVAHRSGAALKLGGDTLAVLQGVRPNQLTNQHFAQVDFATVKGVEVPYVIA
ncbi:pre-peptidase C-terminal domain-containing protein [Phormidium tenue FACHB-886]|nr:pre-peptidase C-terminal domain-containing protein [Phormidium tenue FACHB-886]